MVLHRRRSRKVDIPVSIYRAFYRCFARLRGEKYVIGAGIDYVSILNDRKSHADEVAAEQSYALQQAQQPEPARRYGCSKEGKVGKLG